MGKYISKRPRGPFFQNCIQCGTKFELKYLSDSTLMCSDKCRTERNHQVRRSRNTNAHPGTTLQSVIRCLIERVDYLQNQIPHENNELVKRRLKECLYLLEERAAERHGYKFELFIDEVATMPMCDHCGHVVCPELGNAIKK